MPTTPQRPGTDTVTGRFPPVPESATRARRLAAGACRDWALLSLADVVQLVVGELVTNAVRYTRSEVVLRLVRLADGVRLEVDDEDGSRWPEATSVEPTAESGRGLTLVSAVTRGWGVLLQGRGKRVWAEVAAAG